MASDPVLPPPDQWAALAPGPGSLIQKYNGDARLLLVAGPTLLLQVCHPTVGAGVTEHSTFAQDPWSRLLRTLDFVAVMSYGGPQMAGEMGRRIRHYHRHIKGTLPGGERYHALEPEAYAWVHATLAWGIFEYNKRFARIIPRRDRQAFWDEWRRLGRLQGVRDRDLPARWDDVMPYVDRMVATRLQRTTAADDVLATLSRPSPPAQRGVVAAAWPLARPAAAHVLSLSLAGALPPALRTTLGLPWNAAMAAELEVLAAASRAATPLLPAAVRQSGPAYLQWRRRQISHGNVADEAAFTGRPARAA